MKTENTPEEKARFFALYHGQEIAVFKTTHGTHMVPALVIMTGNSVKQNWHLSLRSISSLTLSEAKIVSDLQDWKDYESQISEDDRRGIRDAIGVAIKNQWLNYTTADYLRSIGILIPWMDLSVEDIKSYGWAKEVEA